MRENSWMWRVMRLCTSTRRNLITIKEIMTPLRSSESKTGKDWKNNLTVNSSNSNTCKSSSTSSGTTPREPVWSSLESRLSTKCNSSKKLSKIPHVSLSSPHPINSDHHSLKLKMDISHMINLKYKLPTIFSEMSALQLIWKAELLSLVPMVSVKVLSWNC